MLLHAHETIALPPQTGGVCVAVRSERLPGEAGARSAPWTGGDWGAGGRTVAWTLERLPSSKPWHSPGPEGAARHLARCTRIAWPAPMGSPCSQIDVGSRHRVVWCQGPRGTSEPPRACDVSAGCTIVNMRSEGATSDRGILELRNCTFLDAPDVGWHVTTMGDGTAAFSNCSFGGQAPDLLANGALGRIFSDLPAPLRASLEADGNDFLGTSGTSGSGKMLSIAEYPGGLRTLDDPRFVALQQARAVSYHAAYMLVLRPPF